MHSERLHQHPTPITLRGCIEAQIIWDCGKVGWEETDSKRTHVPCLKWGSTWAVQEWAASRQRLGCQPSPSHRHGVCIYSHHNPLSSQPGSKPYLCWSRSQVHPRATFLGHQDTAASRFGSLRPQLSDLTAPVKPFFPLSEHSQYASSCLSIFNYPVKLHYITCTKSYPAIVRGCACSIQFNSTILYQEPSIHSFLSTCVEHLLPLALDVQKWKTGSLESSWRDRYMPWCRSSELRRVGPYRLAAERGSDWDQRVPRHGSTQGDISDGPS